VSELPVETETTAAGQSVQPGQPVPLRRLLSLTTSAFFVLAAEPLYLLVDTAVVGHLGSTPLAALGIGATLMSVLLVVGSFVEYGTTSRSARWFGAGKLDDALDEGVQATWISLVVGVLIIAVGELLAGPATRLLAGGVSAEQQQAESWFRIAVVGMPFVLLVLSGNGWMRGVQRTKAPVVIVLVANALSATLSPLLVYTAGLGLNGSAWANLVGQGLGASLFVIALRRSTGHLRPRIPIMRAQLVMGRDLIVRAAAFQAAFLVAASTASRMGTAQIAAHSVGMQLWEFMALVLDSFAIAAQSLVGAALGSGNSGSARHTAWQVARLGGWAGVGFAALMAAGWSVIPAIFTSSPDVLHQLHLIWPWFVSMLPIAGVVFALDGVLIGAGDVAFMRTLTIVAALLGFIPLCLAALHWQWGIGGVWCGLLSFVVIRLVGMVSRTRGDRWLVLGEAT
jgi:putative MATE family efflux protein